ncbi:MAG: hypothetical protein SVO01_05060 [Thermotogota bacterium]|nr:hypothetical protein [Thermotogota bacterium]
MKTKDRLGSMNGSGTSDSILRGVSIRSVFNHFRKEKPNLIILKENGMTIEFGKAVLEKGILQIADNSINAKHEKYDRYGDMWYLWEEGSSETSEWKTTAANTGISAEKLNYLFKIKLLDEIDETNQTTFFFGIALGCVAGLLLFAFIELIIKIV